MHARSSQGHMGMTTSIKSKTSQNYSTIQPLITSNDRDAIPVIYHHENRKARRLFIFYMAPAIIILPLFIYIASYLFESWLNKKYKSVASSNHIYFIPSVNIMITSPVRPISAVFWTWLYTGLTGKDSYSCITMDTNESTNDYNYPILKFSTSCWSDLVEPISSKSKAFIHTMIKSKDILHIAITTDAYASLIATWDSFVKCDDDDDDGSNRNKWKLERLLSHRNISDIKQVFVNNRTLASSLAIFSCLSLDDFSKSLNELPESAIPSLWKPSEYFSNLIDYDIILSDSQVHNISALSPILQRLPFKHLLTGPPPSWGLRNPHIDSNMSLETAYRFHEYARLSERFDDN